MRSLVTKVKLRWEFSGKLQAFDEFFGDGGDARSRIGGEIAALDGIFVMKDDPKSGVVSLVIAGANGAGELRDFNTAAAEEVSQDAAGIVDEVAKPLRDQDCINIARRGLFKLVEIVIGQRLFERDFNGGGGLVLVGCDSNGHGAYGFTPRRSFRIGAAGENGEGAVELLSKHDAGKFVREGHLAERKFLVGALAE